MDLVGTLSLRQAVAGYRVGALTVEALHGILMMCAASLRSPVARRPRNAEARCVLDLATVDYLPKAAVRSFSAARSSELMPPLFATPASSILAASACKPPRTLAPA